MGRDIAPPMRRTVTPWWRKSAEFFSSIFDPSIVSGSLRTFWPLGGGSSAPPVNAARSAAGTIETPKSALTIAAAWACVWLNSDTISTLPFILNRRKGPNYGSPAEDNPLYTVIGQRPNPQMSACEFWQVMIASESLWGNGYARKFRNTLGDVIMLDPLRPEHMVPMRDKDTGLIRYRYYDPIDGTQDFAADDIFHYKGKTLDGLVGLSRIEFARNSLGIARAAETATSDTFRNGLNAAGFITVASFLKQDQRDKMRQSVNRFRSGEEDAGGLMVLEGGMDFKPLSMDPKDVELLSSRQFSVEDVCRWYGVPPVLVGHAAAGVTAWGTGIEQLLLGWLSLSLRSQVRRLEQAIWAQLLKPADRASLYCTIDTDDLLAADSKSRSALYSVNAQNGIMTRNEIRAREDLPPAEGGDVLTVQSNLIPIDMLGTVVTQTQTTAGDAAGAKKAAEEAAGAAARSAATATDALEQARQVSVDTARNQDLERLAGTAATRAAAEALRSQPRPIKDPPLKLYVVSDGGEVVQSGEEGDTLRRRQRRFTVERDEHQRIRTIEESYQ